MNMRKLLVTVGIFALISGQITSARGLNLPPETQLCNSSVFVGGTIGNCLVP